MKTCDRLLHMPGVEVAAQPWLYPRAAFGDTDIKNRLLVLQKIEENAKPSLKTSWVRKLTSSIPSYQADFPLFWLLRDIALAKRISSVVHVAKDKRIAPDEAANNMQNFGSSGSRSSRSSKTSASHRLVFTIASAERSFPYHEGMFHNKVKDKKLSECQALFTLYLYHVLPEPIETLILMKDSDAELHDDAKHWGEDTFDPAAKQYEELGSKHASGERITGADLEQLLALIPDEVKGVYGITCTDVDAKPSQQDINVERAMSRMMHVFWGYACPPPIFFGEKMFRRSMPSRLSSFAGA